MPISEDIPDIKAAMERSFGTMSMDTVKHKTFSRMVMTLNDAYVKTIAKDFCPSRILNSKAVDRLYWMARLRWSSANISLSFAKMIPEFQKLNFLGLLLPNGKKVSFESLHLAFFRFVPRKYNVFTFVKTPVQETFHARLPKELQSN
ncbi:hypothetical protein Bhyg_17910, partial [Pseudolycoriella hygida]